MADPAHDLAPMMLETIQAGGNWEVLPATHSPRQGEYLFSFITEICAREERRRAVGPYTTAEGETVYLLRKRSHSLDP